MRYSLQPRDQILVKGYEFLSFTKNMGKKLSKNLHGKYSQKLLDNAKKMTDLKLLQKSNSKHS